MDCGDYTVYSLAVLNYNDKNQEPNDVPIPNYDTIQPNGIVNI